MKIRILLIVLLFMSFTQGAKTQNFSFSYDASGNRTDRIIVLNKSTAFHFANDSADIGRKEEEITDDVKIILYPNPTKDDVFVSIQNMDSNVSSSLSIYDHSGRLINTVVNLDETNPIGLSGFLSGNYFVIININGNTSGWTIIKE